MASSRATVLALVALLAGSVATAQPAMRGTLSPPGASVSDPAQRYAVYLPTSYSPAQPTPVLFILDSRGRARVAAEVFVPAAERFGWILMSSSNAVSDETIDPAAKALQAMWADAHAMFAIDDRRVYLAGLSGMARLATMAAQQLPGTFAGVIGAGAGFSASAPPSARIDFLYYGTVGEADYNYWEMRGLDDRLTTLGLPHRVAYFDGPHAWMPPTEAMAAIEWMELRTMQRGQCPKDPGLINALWARDIEAVAAFEAAGRATDARRVIAAMVSDYYNLRPREDIAALAVKRATLSTNPAIAAELKHDRAAARAHTLRIDQAMQTIADAFPEDSGTPARGVGQTVLDLGIAELRRTATGGNTASARAAQRVLAELLVQTGFYLPVEAMTHQADSRAFFYLDIAKAVDPADSFAWFLRAKLFVRSNRPADAIAALASAVDRGFRSLGLLEGDDTFKTLSHRDDFQALVARVKAAWAAS